MTAAERELLLRHRPLLRYDRQFDFRAMSAASITDNGCNLLRRADRSVIARPPELSLDLLAAYPPRLEAAAGDHLAAAPDREGDARRMDADPRYADRAYGRVVEDGGRTWLQYWLWYYDNPKHLFGFGRHEGDWELVQVGLGEDGTPEAVTLCQHASAQPRRWQDVECHEGTHPVVYVAPLSHASYFEARTHPYFPGIDHPFGDGPEVLPALDEFGPWIDWPGRWGASTGLVGKSPPGPRFQALRWQRPAQLHSRSRARRLNLALGDVLHALGRATYPLAPQIEARLDGTFAVVEWRLRRTALRRARHLYLTVHVEVDEREQVIASRRLDAPGAQGQVEIPLPWAPGRVTVWASAFNRLRQRSELVFAQAAA